jgi:hypothetical protein
VTRYTPLWLQAGSYPAGLDRRLIATIWPTAASRGLALTAVAGTMTANIAAGRAAVPAANGTGSALCVSDATEVVTFAAAPGSGLQRADTVYLLPRGNDLDGGANNDFIFGVVTGTPSAPPAYATGPPPGALTLYYVTVIGGSASLNNAIIADTRPGNLTPSGVPTSVPLGYVGQISNSISVSVGSAWQNVCGLSVGIATSRVYRATANAYGYQQTSAGRPKFQLVNLGTGGARLFGGAGLIQPGEFMMASGSLVFSMNPGGSGVQFQIQAQTDAGTFTVDPGFAAIDVEDIGAPGVIDN